MHGHFFAGALCAILGVSASAQPYPVRPIQILLSSSPGGGSDAVARMISVALSDSLRQSIVVVNKPGGMNYGSSTIAVALPMELFKSMTGTNIAHILYKGSGLMIIDLLGGQIQTAIAGAAASIPQVKAGKLRALAIADSRRSQILPDLPTIAESGVPGYQATVWTVLLAPAKVPPARLELLNREVVKIVRSANFKDRLHELGSDAVGSTPDETNRFIGAEIAKWTKIIRTTGLQADLAR